MGHLGGSAVKHLTLDLESGHDLMGYEISPAAGSLLTLWNLLGILSLPSVSAPPHTHALCLSLKINKLKEKKTSKEIGEIGLGVIGFKERENFKDE